MIIMKENILMLSMKALLFNIICLNAEFDFEQLFYCWEELFVVSVSQQHIYLDHQVLHTFFEIRSHTINECVF